MSDRWPRWLYGQGTEPDHRFSLANERTLVMVLVAAGLVILLL